MRDWLPAAVVALLLAIGVGTAAYFTFGRGVGGGASPTPSLDLHSKEAVMAAVRHYYDVESEARKTGNASLIDAATIGHASLASQNFHVFVAQQAAKNRRSVIIRNYFSTWAIEFTSGSATASYTWWLRGHDSDATSGQPVEPDMTSTKGSYRATLELQNARWLISEVQLLQDNVP